MKNKTIFVRNHQNLTQVEKKEAKKNAAEADEDEMPSSEFYLNMIQSN